MDFCVEEVRHLIQELFQDDEDGNWPIEKIGITGDYPKGYANMIYDKDWREEYRNYNVMLERRLKANYRTGFWEMIFLHTKPLAAVPSDTFSSSLRIFRKVSPCLLSNWAFDNLPLLSM